MMKLFLRWFQRNFSDPQAVILLMILLGTFLLIYGLSGILAPVFVAVVMAYLLDWIVEILVDKGMRRTTSVLLVFILFIGITLSLILGVIPLIWQQLENLFNEPAETFQSIRSSLYALPEKYPTLITQNQIDELYTAASGELTKQGENIFKASFSSLVNLAAILVYVILVPLLLFFFLKDKAMIVDWCLRWLPKERQLANNVWTEVNSQIGNYVRGKVLEIFIVGSTSFVAFTILDLRYALLLGVLVGFSVLIPYIGAAVVTIPIALIGYVQWGFDTNFAALMIVYAIIQAIDGNLLVPILFSEAVNLHPVAIIVAVLFFGGIWGFWGVFFAIPLATVVKAVISAWDDVKQNVSEEAAAAC